MPIYPAYWQLKYPGGRLATEPPNGETILHAPAGYEELRIIDITGSPVQALLIPLGARAIFYRTRSAGIGTEAELDATVFGYGKVDDSLHFEKLEGRLYLWAGNKSINCPPNLVAEGAIQHLMTSPQGL